MELALAGLLCIGLPVLLVLLLKSNAGAMFLSACAGLVLLLSLDPVVVSAAGSVIPTEGEAYIRLAVVLLSVIFAAVMFRHTVQGPAVLVHLLLAVLTGCTLWLMLPEVTGLSWLSSSSSDDIWQDAKQFQALIVALGFSMSLLVVHTKPSKHHKKH